MRGEPQDEQEEQPENKLDDRRESIWTIPVRLKRWYFALFAIQVILATIWLVAKAIGDETKTGVTDILFYVWRNMAPVAVSSATFTLVIVDGANTIMVLSEWLEETLEKRRRREVKRRREELRAVAEEARADERRKWLEWNQRREAAAAAGHEFTEPPPGASTETQEPLP